LSLPAGDKASTLERVAEQAAGDPTSEGHIVGTAFGGRMLKTLVAGGHYNPKEKKVEGKILLHQP
jgi:pumilio family protein 6